jgi:hypothetical protein
MSQQIIEAVKSVDAMIKIFEGLEIPSSKMFIDKLKAISGILKQNQNKIWLRTKIGKPICDSVSSLTLKMLEKIKTGEDHEEWYKYLDELETQVNVLNEESRRRSMVVT